MFLERDSNHRTLEISKRRRGMKHAGGSPKANAAMTTPKYVWMLALLGTQVANVVGSLYLKLAMVTPTPPHPVVFALYREVLTGAPVLSVCAALLHCDCSSFFFCYSVRAAQSVCWVCMYHVAAPMSSSTTTRFDYAGRQACQPVRSYQLTRACRLGASGDFLDNVPCSASAQGYAADCRPGLVPLSQPAPVHPGSRLGGRDHRIMHAALYPRLHHCPLHDLPTGAAIIASHCRCGMLCAPDAHSRPAYLHLQR